MRSLSVNQQRLTTYHHKGQRQGKSENIDENVSALKRLSKTCRLGVLEEERIRDQIIMHTSNPNIQDTLWVTGEEPLKEVIALVKKVELTGQCAEDVEGELQEVKHVHVIKGEKKNYKNDTKAKVNNYKVRIEQIFFLPLWKCGALGGQQEMSCEKPKVFSM
ncbi:hypothetical protein NDU88_007321 [Pleurodeles waltl]|uniref:Uncharacterized protein n=1 Tax=Pleurodeles waltl TaxID=8319 RepID=A0AAV7N3E1_PLEWA|nr:hypothetical protein NDU88_007321 [Pleurodeles waltl]